MTDAGVADRAIAGGDGRGRLIAPSAGPDQHRDRRLVVGLGVLGLVLAVALRIIVYASGLVAPDSDEAVIGLVGLHATRGDVDLMFWGQAYGGTIEGLAVAPLFALFGPSVMVGRLFLLVITGICAVLTWRIGRRTVGDPAAAVGAVLFWTMSSYFVWYSTKMNIYYGALTFALVVVLLLLRLRDDDVPRWWPIAFGLSAGAAAWSNPQTMFLLFPALMAHIRPMVAHLKSVMLAVPFAVLGFSPWLVFSLRNDWKTLKVPGVDVYLPYTERVLLYFRQLPIVFGGRLPMTNEWLIPQAAFLAIAVLGVVALAWGVARGWPGLRLLTFLAFGYAFVYALSPQGGQPGANLQPRYLLFITPVLTLGLAALVSRVRVASIPVLGLAVLVVISALTGVGLLTMRDTQSTLASSGPGANVPADISDLLSLLRDQDVDHAYSFYWLAYRTTFESREKTIVTPAFKHISRYQPYAEAAREDPDAAIVAMRNPAQIQALQQRLDSLRITYEMYERGEFVVIVPNGKVEPEEIAGAFREAGIFA